MPLFHNDTENGASPEIKLHYIKAIGDGACLYNSMSIVLTCKFLQDPDFAAAFDNNPSAQELSRLIQATYGIPSTEKMHTPSQIFKNFIDVRCEDWRDLQKKLAPLLREVEANYCKNALQSKQYLFSKEALMIIQDDDLDNDKKPIKAPVFFISQFESEFEYLYGAWVDYRKNQKPTIITHHYEYIERFLPGATPAVQFRDGSILSFAFLDKISKEIEKYQEEDSTIPEGFNISVNGKIHRLMLNAPETMADLFAATYVRLEKKRFEFLTDLHQNGSKLPINNFLNCKEILAIGANIASIIRRNNELDVVKTISDEFGKLSALYNLDQHFHYHLVDFLYQANDNLQVIFKSYLDVHFSHQYAFGNVRDGKMLCNLFNIRSLFCQKTPAAAQEIIRKKIRRLPPEMAGNFLRIPGKTSEFLQIQRIGDNHFDVEVSSVYLNLKVGTQQETLSEHHTKDTEYVLPPTLPVAATDNFDGTALVPSDLRAVLSSLDDEDEIEAIEETAPTWVVNLKYAVAYTFIVAALFAIAIVALFIANAFGGGIPLAVIVSFSVLGTLFFFAGIAIREFRHAVLDGFSPQPDKRETDVDTINTVSIQEDNSHHSLLEESKSVLFQHTSSEAPSLTAPTEEAPSPAPNRLDVLEQRAEDGISRTKKDT